jgi:hypothetical protein
MQGGILLKFIEFKIPTKIQALVELFNWQSADSLTVLAPTLTDRVRTAVLLTIFFKEIYHP